MGIRKSTEETFVVSGTREEWLKKTQEALTEQGFTKIKASDTLFQIEANYKKLTVWGNIILTLIPEGGDTKINAKATANVDNIFALFKSPGQTILSAFKSGLH
jgi:hypothetical protein